MENTVPQLHDIHLPDNPGIWPLAVGWWILLALLLLIALWVFLKRRKQLKLKKQRDVIFAKLDRLEKHLKEKPSNHVIAEINTLLRQLAVNYYPRARIASLTGAQWLQFLDQSGKTQDFTKGAGRILIDAPYQPDDSSGNLNNFNKDEFIPLIRRWVKKVVQTGGVNHESA